jgi:hypothetical protein
MQLQENLITMPHKSVLIISVAKYVIYGIWFVCFFLQVSDDKKKIRRSPNSPLPVLNEERRQELMSRTVYCKGFPRDGTTLDNLLEFFSSYGSVENIHVITSKVLIIPECRMFWNSLCQVSGNRNYFVSLGLVILSLFRRCNSSVQNFM